MNKYVISPDNAPKFLDWLANRGGVAVWRNCNMSSQALGTEVFTPATHTNGSPATSPGWQYGHVAKEIVTDASLFTVQTWREVARVKAVPSKYGPPCYPVARGRAKLDAAVVKAGPDANWRWNPDYYQYGSAWREIIVEVPATIVPLSEWVSSTAQA